MENSVILSAQKLLELAALVIISGVLSAKLSRIIKLPDVVVFILVGILLGPHGFNIINIDKSPVGNQLILIFGAAYILYDGGREINLKVLNKVKISVAALSTVGVIVSAFVTGYFACIILKIDFIYALLIGSVIASTDPSVLIPLFKNMNVSDKLKQTIISESAFNDAAGAIITFAVLGVITGGAFSLTGSVLDLAKQAFGGGLVGVVMGFISSTLITDNKYGFLKEFPSEVSIAFVIGAYLIADKFGLSGFMAVFVVGMVCGNKKMLNMWIPEEYYQTHTRFKEVLTIILRMMIFILLGTHIDFNVLRMYWKESLAVVAILIFVARPVSVLVSVILDKQAKWNYREILYLMWVRETGVIPAALAGMLVTMKIPNAEIISAVTFTAIIITLTFQASTSMLLAKILKLDKPQKSFSASTTSAASV